MHIGDQIQWKKQNQITRTQQTIDLAVSNRGTHWFSALLSKIYENYKKDRRQTNAYMERLWFLTNDTNTNFRFAVKRLNRKQQLSINTMLLQNSPKFTWGTPLYYAFSRSTKHAKRFPTYSQGFSKICFRVKIWLVVVRSGQKLHCPTSSLDSIFHGISIQDIWHTLFLVNKAVIFLYSLCIACELRSTFLNIGTITPVCHSISFDVLPNFHATWHTRVSQRIPWLFKLFNISGLISSSPAAF